MTPLLHAFAYDAQKQRVGNHEDVMVTVRYGFQNEVNQKYSVSMTQRAEHLRAFVYVCVAATKRASARSIQRSLQLAAAVLVCRRRQIQVDGRARRHLRSAESEEDQRRVSTSL